MDFPYIHGRRSLDDASELIDQFGELALHEAATRARESRDAGNVQRFCHWRQIERMIAAFDQPELTGPLH
jgi:hypothetical protein